jgi:hypothetical protein
MTDRPDDSENSSPSQHDQIVAEKQITAYSNSVVTGGKFWE